MGANCCTASHSKSSQTVTRISTGRNIRYSPSWSFQWDNRTHTEDTFENFARFSHGDSGNVGSEIKSLIHTESEGHSDGSPFSSLQTPMWQKSPSLVTAASTVGGETGTDASIGSNSSMEEYDPMKSAIKSDVTNSKPLTDAPFSSEKLDPSSSQGPSVPFESSSLRKSYRSPRQLSRQISDSHIPVFRSLNENNSSEGRRSFVLPACSSELSNVGSHGGSSDGWSMRMFTELVASSQRDRWSFDSDNLTYCHNKITGTNSQRGSPSSIVVQTCGVCSKLLKERSWKSVVAVLDCGHVYHAECLENVTLEKDKFDPPCPICASGGKASTGLLTKAEFKTRSKRSRIAVADVDLHTGVSSGDRKGFDRNQKNQKALSFNIKRSLSKPFLKRHFPVGSRIPSQSIPADEIENTRKKGFWARFG